MSNLFITYAQLKRGPTSCFEFSILTADRNFVETTEKLSETFEIGKLAKVQLQFKYSSCGHRFNIFVFFRKNILSGNALPKITFSSETLKYSASSFCTENWLSLPLGELPCTYIKIFKLDMYTTKMNLIVHVSTEDIVSNPLLYEDQDFTDFDLLAADGSVAVHRACLAARSDVFRRMFAGEWKETVEKGVEVKDVTKQTLQDLKDFIYLGKLPNDGLQPLIVVAKKYMITDLVEACAKKLAETVLPEDLYSLHELTGFPELSCALAELTPDRVVHAAYEIKMAKTNAALNKDIKAEE